jgi:NAD+ kinase
MTGMTPGTGAVAVIYQPMRADTMPLAERCAAYVSGHGRPVRLYSSWDLGPSKDTTGLGLAIAFGGDGSLLRVARWLADSQVPIVGVKMGRLGFLSELTPDDLFEGLDPFLAGDYWLDVRTMLRAERLPGNGPAIEPIGDLPLVALNDAVVSRGMAGRAVRLTLEVDGTELMHYTADGVVMATATGSTAYSFAAGGPILMPELPNLVVTPICAHIHGINGLVLPPDVAVTVRVSTDQPAGLTLDGHIDFPLLDGQAVTLRAARERTLFARRGARSTFYRALLDKLR